MTLYTYISYLEQGFDDVVLLSRLMKALSVGSSSA
ncbi:unnamed protein product [Musa acuminata subsp. malaccensis]|uniref:(wild Malaysian banana) hypothetical protein n=1 Tax=Musa acuminata subsp. malaccensis TaxID=214687 RepID=A0A8D7FGV2_MUSAM|nr:unnamed protein product [Musa acuminata subsp. malaccensis]